MLLPLVSWTKPSFEFHNWIWYFIWTHLQSILQFVKVISNLIIPSSSFKQSRICSFCYFLQLISNHTVEWTNFMIIRPFYCKWKVWFWGVAKSIGFIFQHEGIKLIPYQSIQYIQRYKWTEGWTSARFAKNNKKLFT